MSKKLVRYSEKIVRNIYAVRGMQVMLDSHLANLYGVETKVLNQAVKRNAKRFPADFMFQINDSEWQNLKSQFVTSSVSAHGGARKLPMVFTELGVAMLSAILKSETAVAVSIRIMQAFVSMRQYLAHTKMLMNRIEKVEHKQLAYDKHFEKIFTALEKNDSLPDQGVFFNGQIFDAYKFVTDIIRRARQHIVLVDNYVDENTLQLFAKRKSGIAVHIYTQKIMRQLELDVQKFNKQYGPVQLYKIANNHDRFLIVDQKEMYHIGASLKDLGNKIFGFSKMDTQTFRMLNKLKEPVQS